MKRARVRHPQHAAVPTLTEVVELDSSALEGKTPATVPALELVSRPARSADDLAAGGLNSAQSFLTQRVLQSIQHQVDEVLDQRLKDALVPILARCAESLIDALRQDLASTLHDVVAKAVASELSRSAPRT